MVFLLKWCFGTCRGLVTPSGMSPPKSFTRECLHENLLWPPLLSRPWVQIPRLHGMRPPLAGASIMPSLSLSATLQCSMSATRRLHLKASANGFGSCQRLLCCSWLVTAACRTPRLIYYISVLRFWQNMSIFLYFNFKFWINFCFFNVTFDLLDSKFCFQRMLQWHDDWSTRICGQLTSSLSEVYIIQTLCIHLKNQL